MSHNESNAMQVDMVHTIKNILRQYSLTQLVPEFLQNACDAGADRVRFILDKRTWFTNQGLIVFNSGVFTANDWKGLQLTFKSTKTGDALKTGQFGIGFRSSFHITDTPVVVSGPQIRMFDPAMIHAQSLSTFAESNGDIFVNFTDQSNLNSLNEVQKQIVDEILRRLEGIENFHPTQPFHGTIVILPLRLPNQRNRFSDEQTHIDFVQELSDEFRRFACDSCDLERCLLFLKHTSTIEFDEILPNVTTVTTQDMLVHRFSGKRSFTGTNDQEYTSILKHLSELKARDELATTVKEKGKMDIVTVE